jgi:hypothetical protein
VRGFFVFWKGFIMSRVKEGEKRKFNQAVIDEVSFANVPVEHRLHAKERAKNLAKIRAEALGIPLLEEMGTPQQGDFGIYNRPLSWEEANKSDIRTQYDLSGAVFKYPEHAKSKIIFAESISGENTHDSHPQKLAKKLRKKGVVLETVAAYRLEDLEAYMESRSNDPNATRMKVPDESDGNGQIVIDKKQDLPAALEAVGLSKEAIKQRGVILEPNLENVKGTHSAGEFVYGGQLYAIVIEQLGDVVTKEVNGKTIKQNRFLGGKNAKVVRGGVAKLRKLPGLTREEKLAIKNAHNFKRAVTRELQPIWSRWTVDNVTGDVQTVDGKIVTKTIVTDGSYARDTGTDPIALLLAKYLRENPDMHMATGRVDLLYGKNMDKQPKQEGEVIFVNQHDLRIVAKVLDSYTMEELKKMYDQAIAA